jgi:hypothetical protein
MPKAPTSYQIILASTRMTPRPIMLSARAAVRCTQISRARQTVRSTQPQLQLSWPVGSPPMARGRGLDGERRWRAMAVSESCGARRSPSRLVQPYAASTKHLFFRGVSGLSLRIPANAGRTQGPACVPIAQDGLLEVPAMSVCSQQLTRPRLVSGAARRYLLARTQGHVAGGRPPRRPPRRAARPD